MVRYDGRGVSASIDTVVMAAAIRANVPNSILFSLYRIKPETTIARVTEKTPMDIPIAVKPSPVIRELIYQCPAGSGPLIGSHISAVDFPCQIAVIQ